MANASTQTIWQLREGVERALAQQTSKTSKTNVRFDVVVIGAGVAGLVTALRCAQDGQSVQVIEREGIGQGESLRTTAHLASALDDRFYELARKHGDEGARLAAASHAEAIDWIEEFVASDPQRCRFHRVPGYLFSHDGTRGLLRKEAQAASAAGLSTEYLEDGIPGLPHLGPAVRFDRQARIDMGLYLTALVEANLAHGVQFERAEATDVHGGSPATVQLSDGWTLFADAVVVATNVPFHKRVTLHTKQMAYRSYVVAGTIAKGALPDALLWDDDDPYHYVRLAEIDGVGHVAVIGGEDHKTGQDEDPKAFARLQEWANDYVPGVEQYTHGWSGQIIEPVDGLAYIGADPGGEANVFVVTGDSGNGVTHGTLGGLLIADLIAGRANPWAKLYDPSRKPVRAAGEWIRENTNVVLQFRDWLTGSDAEAVHGLARGEGLVIRRGLHRVAVYRNSENTLVTFNARCPHLGCVVRWSTQETWDCPCHGSRFSAETGEVLNGPANRALSPNH